MKNNKTKGGCDCIALVSAPWPMFSRPSIQLSVLKAYLKSAFPDMTLFCHHYFLSLAKAIGYPVYKTLSQRIWLAESVYAALLYPEREERIARFFAEKAKKSKELSGLEFPDFIQYVRRITTDFIKKTDWAAMDLVGFSVCSYQFTASLYFIREIRRRAPNLPLIAGGSLLGGRTAGDLLEVFPEIDLIITGEGERPLAQLVRHLRTGGHCDDISPTPGIVGRQNKPSHHSDFFCQLESLETLPIPDFSDYFDLLAAFPGDKRFFPTLPVEISRGCWWRVDNPDMGNRRQSKGCAFCNLNIQWQGYRSKTVDQVVNEIDHLTDKHKVLSFALVDNVLPLKKSRKIFTALHHMHKDFQFFAELRASTTRQMLEQYYHAGITDVQIGIEALSSRLLNKLNKGTSVMDNMEIMKGCEALGIINRANLMLHFPGSDEVDVAETLRVIKYARYFRPLRIVHFWLGMHSPVWENPQKYGLTAVFNHPYYKVLFPEAVFRKIRFVIQDYRGDKIKQRRLWSPVTRAVKKWQQDYYQLHSDPHSGPILTLHDGQSFLILRERRVNREPMNHRLEGTSRKIYLFCEHRRRFKEITNRFPSLSADNIRAFLIMMTEKGLMFEDQEKYLSLAVPA